VEHVKAMVVRVRRPGDPRRIGSEFLTVLDEGFSHRKP